MKKRVDYTAEFPHEITTATRGVLHLRLSSLMAGDEELAKFCRYEMEINDGGIDASFHPNITKPPDSPQWQEIFDRRFREFESGWRQFLTANANVIRKRVVKWLPAERSITDLFESLRLKRVLVSVNERVTLQFVTSPMLKHHDLEVQFDERNRVVAVRIEG